MTDRRSRLLVAATCAAFVWLGLSASAAVSTTPDLSKPETPSPGRARIEGTVIWEGQSLTGTTLYLYDDPGLRRLRGGSPLLSSDGSFDMRVRPGTYYLVAVVDRDQSGRFDHGDALGVHGIRSWGDSREHKVSITVGDGQKATGVRVHISAVREETDEVSRIVPIGGASMTLPDARSVGRGVVRGRVSQLGAASLGVGSAYVFAYADPTWKQRVGSARVADDGSYSLSLPPGRYYVSAILDANGSNLFDAGDAFGVLGAPSEGDKPGLRQSAIPVTVRAGVEATGADIELAARQDESGKLVSIEPGSEPEQGAEPTDAATIALKGRIKGIGTALGATTVTIYDDASLRTPIAQTVADPSGYFALAVPPGEYFVLANVDRDGNGRLSPTDAVGAQGVTDIITQPLRRVSVDAETPEIEVRISATYDRSAQLIPVEPDSSDDAESASSLDSKSATGVLGRVTWDGHAPSRAWVLVAATRDFANATIFEVPLDRDGYFVLPTPAGTRYIMAIVDSNEDEAMGMGDGVAIYGTRDPVLGSPAPVLVRQDRLTPYVTMSVSAVVTDDAGGYAAIDDGNRSMIRRKYGEPDDRLQRHEGANLVEEWWYWLEGVSFKFVAEGPGWALDDVYHFDPKPDALASVRPNDIDVGNQFESASTVNAALYYSSDGVIWGMLPDGSQEPLALGMDPVPTPTGFLYRTLDGDISSYDGGSRESAVVLPRESGIGEMANSPDATLLAYTRVSDAGLQLRIRRWATREELIVPVPVDRVANPSWNRDASLLAFSTAERGAPPSNGDIYVYDPAANRFEPLIDGASDDREPAWSPTNPRTLAFSRESDGVRQVWTASYREPGSPTLTQVTQSGGEQPAWLPDGSGIVYVVSGQLWVVDLSSGNERPLLVNQSPVIGGGPATFPIR